MREEIRTAIASAILSAGAWAEMFEKDTIITLYRPNRVAGIISLKRKGNESLIPEYLRELNMADYSYDVVSLGDAKDRVFELNLYKKAEGSM